VQNDVTPQDAAAAAQKEIADIVDKWKQTESAVAAKG
jgi:hypothetical protein